MALRTRPAPVASAPAVKAEPETMQGSGFIYSYDGASLLIQIDLSPETVKAAKLSGTGKSKVIATSHGFSTLAGSNPAVKFSLNCITEK